MNRMIERMARAASWATLDAILALCAGFATIFLVAAFLSPAEFGEASLAITIVFLVDSLATFGLVEAIVRTRTPSRQFLGTVMTLGLTLSSGGVVICIAVAAAIALLDPSATLPLLICVGAPVLWLNALSVVPVGTMTRKLRAASLTRRLLAGRLAGVIVLFALASNGVGALSFVVANVTIAAVQLFSLLGYRHWPRLAFDGALAGHIIRFSGSIGVDTLFWTVGVRAYSLVFGGLHGVAALGQFQFAMRLTEELSRLFQSAGSRYGLTYFVTIRHQGGNLGSAFANGALLLSVIGAPALAGATAVAPTLFPLVFGEAWQGSVAFFQVLALAWIFVLPRSLVGSVLRASGHVWRATLLTGVNALVLLLLLAPSIWAGPTAGVLAWLVRDALSLLLAAYALSTTIGLNAPRYLKDFGIVLCAAVAMAALVLLSGTVLDGVHPAARFALQVGVGMLTYIGLLLVFHRPAFRSARRVALKSIGASRADRWRAD